MIILEINRHDLGILLIMLVVALAWIIPIVMLIVGLIRLKTRPKNAKTLLIISGIWLLIGIGFCGTLMA